MNVRKLFNYILFAFLTFLVVITLYINYKLYDTPTYIPVGNTNINKSLVFQLRHLKSQMHEGAATKMQQLFPEGYVFMNALYGLTWTELATHLSQDDALYQEAMTEINWVIENLESEEGKKVFDAEQALPYGIFYNGWYNYVLGKKIRLQTLLKTDSLEASKFRTNCAKILGTLKRSKSPFLESYQGACWPADMTVAMASLAIGDVLYEGEYKSQIILWLQQVESRTDALGLLPHSTILTGDVKEGARGSSQSLILNFLFEIDSVYAKAKFEIYKRNFLDYQFGLPGIREYPIGIIGAGDIDSGPVILGMGGAATIVGQRTMKIFGEDNIASGIRGGIEAFGLSFSRHKSKSYLLSQLPMADAFIAWSNSTEVNENDAIQANKNWRLKFQLLSFVLIFFCVACIAILRKG